MSDFTVVAIMSAHNESDVIAQVVGDLIGQGIQVYLIDDGSTDGTVSAVGRWLNKGLIAVERRPPGPSFEWTEILRRKEQLAADLDAAWFMHQDADELRESPWQGLDLCQAIHEVDRLGYNAVEFKVLNFRPTSDEFQPGDDLRAKFRFYEPAEQWDATQIKCWKKERARVDLSSSGGHEAEFEGRRVCPVQFLSRHYPIRNRVHGQRKVFSERKPRFVKAEQDRGWHRHYDHLSIADPFVHDPSTLREYDPEAVRLDLMQTHRDTERLAFASDELSDLRQRSSHQSVELEREQQRAIELEGRVSSLNGKLDATRGEIARLQERYELECVAAAGRQAALEEQLLAERRRAAGESEAKERAIQGGQAEIRSLQAELSNRSAENAALYSSWSWRLTRPLRTVYGWLFAREISAREGRDRSPKARS